jgi:hypothetical protein
VERVLDGDLAHRLLGHLGFDVTRLTGAMLDMPDPNHASER